MLKVLIKQSLCTKLDHRVLYDRKGKLGVILLQSRSQRCGHTPGHSERLFIRVVVQNKKKIS